MTRHEHPAGRGLHHTPTHLVTPDGVARVDELFTPFETAVLLETTVEGLGWWRVHRGLRALNAPGGETMYDGADIVAAARRDVASDPMREARALGYVLIAAAVVAAGVLIWWVTR